MSKIPHQLIKLANECADESGKIIKKYFRKKMQISIKKDNTPFTRADVEGEKVIKELILKKDPQSGFVGEETKKVNPNNEYCWVVDPLDGFTRINTPIKPRSNPIICFEFTDSFNQKYAMTVVKNAVVPLSIPSIFEVAPSDA